MTQAKLGDTVKVHYTGRLDDDTVFDSSVDRDPLEFTLGTGNIIPGFEAAVVGMSIGDAKTAQISVEQGYGPHREEMVMVIERAQMPADMQPEVGQQLQIQQQSGEAIPVIVTEVSDDEITLDANHPLAGEVLIFEIELVEIA